MIRARIPGGAAAMVRGCLMVAVLLVQACTSGPRGSAVVRVTPDGVRVAPVISGRLGNVDVSVSP